MSVGQRADVSCMSQLVEKRWTRYGKDRVYVRNEAGDEIGHVDLKEHTIAVKAEGYEASLEDCLRRWKSEPGIKTQSTLPLGRADRHRGQGFLPLTPTRGKLHRPSSRPTSKSNRQRTNSRNRQISSPT